MSRKLSGLGRGLEALIPKSQGSLTRLPLALIRPNPEQPRKHFDPESLAELAASIKQKGLLQPLLVRPKGDLYELVAGERRYRAAQEAGLSEVPVIIRDLSEREVLEVALIENLQREDLNPLEEALGYQRLIEMGASQEEVAMAVGKARATVSNALRLLQLPPAALEALRNGQITAGHARALLMLPEEQRGWGLNQILGNQLSVRDAERLKERTPPASHNRQRSEAYAEIARTLTRQLGFKVRFSGEKKGKLEISYHSEEELNALLQRLGYEA